MARWPDIFFAGYASRASLSQAAKAGSIVRLATGIYTGLRLMSPATVARQHWREILGHEFPGAVLADRSARTTQPDEAGRLFVVHRRRRPVTMPGLTILPRPGPIDIEGDTKIEDKIALSSPARGLLDNLGGTGERYLSTAEVERWITDILDIHGIDRLNEIRDVARRIAPSLRRITAMKALDRIIAAALSSGPAEVLITQALRSHVTGHPIDPARVELFTALAVYLVDQAPEILADDPALAKRRTLLPFYEAYFSNYIEGTEFTLDEAADIALAGNIPADRLADAHDIAGTYRVTSDPVAMATVPRDPEHLIELLHERHRAVMEGRPDQRPGLFKTIPNRAGATHFVAPDKVEGTLRVGFEVGDQIHGPLARAMYLMFLMAEVHPFADGNGRVARLLMNSEFVHAGEVRLIIPTVYRNNHVAALRAASHNSAFDALYATLSFARRYTAKVDFTDRGSAERDLERTNALLDPNLADTNGIRLVMP